MRVERDVKYIATRGSEEVSIQFNSTGEVSKVKASSVFIFIGAEPRTNWLEEWWSVTIASSF